MTLDTILVFKHAKKTYYILQIHNTNTKLKLPSDVVCQREDLTSGYAMLCVMMNENQPKLTKE